jgi:DNA-binding XRE family transcriptional regulator
LPCRRWSIMQKKGLRQMKSLETKDQRSSIERRGRLPILSMVFCLVVTLATGALLDWLRVSGGQYVARRLLKRLDSLVLPQVCAQHAGGVAGIESGDPYVETELVPGLVAWYIERGIGSALEQGGDTMSSQTALEAFGDYVRVMRTHLGYTREALAGLVGVTPAYVMLLEKGLVPEERITEEMLAKLGSALAVRPCVLVEMVRGGLSCVNPNLGLCGVSAG